MEPRRPGVSGDPRLAQDEASKQSCQGANLAISGRALTEKREKAPELQTIFFHTAGIDPRHMLFEHNFLFLGLLELQP